MSCFTNYKYVHISFIASIHTLVPVSLLDRKVAPNYPQTTRSSSVKGEVSFASSHREETLGVNCSLLFCSCWLSQGVTVEACFLTDGCCCPGGWDALGGLSSGLQPFLIQFPTLSCHFPKYGPRAGWLDGKGHPVSATF